MISQIASSNIVAFATGMAHGVTTAAAAAATGVGLIRANSTTANQQLVFEVLRQLQEEQITHLITQIPPDYHNRSGIRKVSWEEAKTIIIRQILPYDQPVGQEWANCEATYANTYLETLAQEDPAIKEKLMNGALYYSNRLQPFELTCDSPDGLLLTSQMVPGVYKSLHLTLTHVPGVFNQTSAAPCDNPPVETHWLHTKSVLLEKCRRLFDGQPHTLPKGITPSHVTAFLDFIVDQYAQYLDRLDSAQKDGLRLQYPMDCTITTSPSVTPSPSDHPQVTSALTPHLDALHTYADTNGLSSADLTTLLTGILSPESTQAMTSGHQGELSSILASALPGMTSYIQSKQLTPDQVSGIISSSIVSHQMTRLLTTWLATTPPALTSATASTNQLLKETAVAMVAANMTKMVAANMTKNVTDILRQIDITLNGNDTSVSAENQGTFFTPLTITALVALAVSAIGVTIAVVKARRNDPQNQNDVMV